ncbi:hypothetical protein SCLCIDRAFT_689093 [Scleroderma citrinum Foug A]|uniref:Uncharacterized protein n=1 Tax=Scleroderma citrinum Foug A TaxID=1036808 RepID=A0A0C2ZQB9_9AGAM|nr:hypothetical protein SCLCIDRAFT_689093 [Scleroderma citrinum Foug A]
MRDAVPSFVIPSHTSARRIDGEVSSGTSIAPCSQVHTSPTKCLCPARRNGPCLS